MPRVTISLEAVAARQALVLGRRLVGDSAPHTEYLCDADAPVNASKEMRRNLRMAALPTTSAAAHAVPFEGGLTLRLECAGVAAGAGGGGPDVLSIDGPDYATVDRFLDAARKHCEDAVTAPRAGDTTRRYIYDAGYWERLGDAPRRPPESVFLTGPARELVADVVRFMTEPGVRERHRRHGVPYKLNVLLHGPPGTGKTSLIDSVAGQLGSDVFVVQFTARLRDTDLAVAMRRVADHPNPIIVMEDVDCIFSERKRHDSAKNAITLSGFLNALDGMSRPEGSVVFLTTNDAACLDPAVTRSRRIDRALDMAAADAGQTMEMVRAFFPCIDDRKAEDFCRGCATRAYTTADLHEYLFGCADEPRHQDFADVLRRKGVTAGGRADFCPMYL